MNNRSVLIAGAGIAGPTLAYWLERRGFQPTIVERAPALRTGGYLIDFWGVGYDVAERMGLVPALREDGYRITAVHVIDAHGRTAAELDVRTFQGATHGRFLSLQRSDLSRRIYELLASQVETVFGNAVAGLDEDATGVTVTFEHGAARHFDLVVAADGLHSGTRALAFGDGDAAALDLGYYTAAFTTDDYPHRDEGRYVSFSIPRRQIARYALRGGRSAFFFVFVRQESVPIGHRHEEEQRAALRTAFAGQGWECDEILERLDGATDLYFDVVAQERRSTWARGRVALVGDAAYCPSLLAGQGSALAMAGAYVLANELATAGGDYRTAYNRYEHAFKPFVDAKQRAAAKLGWWFAPETALGIWLRNRAMDLLGLPGFGSLLIGRSLGDRFVLPA